MFYIGEIASLMVAFLWSIGPTYFTLAGNKLGPWVVNRTRMIYALLLVMIIHIFIYGSLLPLDASLDRWIWLFLSGVIGLGLGDIALFYAFTTIGTRLSMLIYSLAPVLSAIAGIMFFNEKLSFIQIIAILITITAIAYVGALSKEKKDDIDSIESKKYWLGIGAAILAAIGQALGLILSKMGIAGDFPTISGLLIRLLGGAVLIWGMAIFQKQVSYTIQAVKKDRKSHLYIWIGTLTGPIGGIYFSLLGLKYTTLGIASVLQSLSPIFLLPIGVIVFREKITWKAIVGTIVAMVGVAILFLG